MISEAILFGAVRKKLHSFRVCPSTKVKKHMLPQFLAVRTDCIIPYHQIILHDEPNVFTVDNGGGTSITIFSQGRECIAATYHKFKINISGTHACKAVKCWTNN